VRLRAMEVRLVRIDAGVSDGLVIKWLAVNTRD